MPAVSTEEEAFGAQKSRSTGQPSEPPALPLEPEPSEPEDVVVVVGVVESEPPSELELDPEEPPSEETSPDPSRPELVEVLLPLALPSVVGWTTAVVSPEPSWSPPDELSPEDVPRSPLPEPDSRGPSPRLWECSSWE